MKWGVRRYQNKDGSYTKEGLAHYRKSEASYNKAASNLKSAIRERSMSNVKKSLSEMKQAKKNMNTHYDLLKNDRLADEGKKIHEKEKNKKPVSKKKKSVAAFLAGTMIMGTPLGALKMQQAIIGYVFYKKNRKKKLDAYYNYTGHPTTE